MGSSKMAGKLVCLLVLVSSVSCELHSLAGRDRRVTTRHRPGVETETVTVTERLEPRTRPRTRIRWRTRSQKSIKDEATPNVIFRTEHFRARQTNPKRRIYLGGKDTRKEEETINEIITNKSPRIPNTKGIDIRRLNAHPTLSKEYVHVKERMMTKPRVRAGLMRLKYLPRLGKERRRLNRRRVKKFSSQAVISKKNNYSPSTKPDLLAGITFSPILSPQVQFLKSQLQKPHMAEEDQDTILLPRETFAGHPAEDIDLNTGTFTLAVGL